MSLQAFIFLDFLKAPGPGFSFEFTWNLTEDAPKAFLFSNLKITVSYLEGMEDVIVLFGPVYVEPLYNLPVVFLKFEVVVFPQFPYYVLDFIQIIFISS